eukprot:sb/3470605/
MVLSPVVALSLSLSRFSQARFSLHPLTSSPSSNPLSHFRYYHRVKSTDRNFAVSLLFGTTSTFSMSPDCQTDPAPSLPLDKVPVQWTYPGHGMMSMGNSCPVDMKQTFLDEFTHFAGEGVEEVAMADYIDHILDEVIEEIPYVHKAFHRLFIEERVLGESEMITREYLDSLPDSFYINVTAAYSYDPSNDGVILHNQVPGG